MKHFKAAWNLCDSRDNPSQWQKKMVRPKCAKMKPIRFQSKAAKAIWIFHSFRCYSLMLYICDVSRNWNFIRCSAINVGMNEAKSQMLIISRWLFFIFIKILLCFFFHYSCKDIFICLKLWFRDRNYILARLEFAFASKLFSLNFLVMIRDYRSSLLGVD